MPAFESVDGYGDMLHKLVMASFHVGWNPEQDLDLYCECGPEAKEVYLWNYLFSTWVLYFIQQLDCFIDVVMGGQNYRSNGLVVVPVDDGPLIHPLDVKLARITFDSVVDAKFEEVMMSLKALGSGVNKVERADNAYGMPQVVSVEVEEAGDGVRELALKKFVDYARKMNRITNNMLKEVYLGYRVRVHNRRFIVKGVEGRLKEYKAFMVDFYYDVMLKDFTVK